MKSIEEIMQLEDYSVIKMLLTSRKRPFKVPLPEIVEQLDPMQHKVMNPLIRKKKRIKVKTDKVDTMTGETIYKERLVDRCRVSIPVQNIIRERTVGFLFSEPVTYRPKSKLSDAGKSLLENVMNIFDYNKIDYFDKKLARRQFTERETAELWYFILDEQGKPKEMKAKLLSPLLGDKLYPHFDDYDRMDGFARQYRIYDESNNAIEHFDVYTDKWVYRYRDSGKGIEMVDKPKLHGFTKVPVIYYRQEEAEWEPVQPVIERIEELLSNWGDINDYFGSPSYFAKGKIGGFADKGEVGRVYQGTGDNVDMKVLSWDSSPESMSRELANLFNIVFSYTQTPDVSFENMKTLGNMTSGAAIRLMFTDPHMKAEMKVELFGEMFTRRFNLVKDGYITSLASPAIPENVANEVKVEPQFHPYLPQNMTETIQMIQSSTGGKPTMSQEEGVRLNPLNENPDEVVSQIQNEQKMDALQSVFGQAQ